LDTGTKRKNDIVKYCLLDMDGVIIVVDLNIIPLGSYNIMIGMDWLDAHHVVLDCHINTSTCFGEEGK
jgi:hypothetical protein